MKSSHWQGFPSKSIPQIPDTDSAWLQLPTHKGADGESKICDAQLGIHQEHSRNLPASTAEESFFKENNHSPSSSSEGESSNTSNALSEGWSSEQQAFLSAFRKPFKKLLVFKLLKPRKRGKNKIKPTTRANVNVVKEKKNLIVSPRFSNPS